MNPLDPEDAERDRIRRAWASILAGEPPDEPWLGLPAVSRVTASTPRMLAPFPGRHEGLSYDEQVKPFNFLLSASVAPLRPPRGG
jgi:hypothetical protein